MQMEIKYQKTRSFAHLIGPRYIAGKFRIAMFVIGINAQSKENCTKFDENHADGEVQNAPWMISLGVFFKKGNLIELVKETNYFWPAFKSGSAKNRWTFDWPKHVSEVHWVNRPKDIVQNDVRTNGFGSMLKIFNQLQSISFDSSWKCVKSNFDARATRKNESVW